MLPDLTESAVRVVMRHLRRVTGRELRVWVMRTAISRQSARGTCPRDCRLPSLRVGDWRCHIAPHHGSEPSIFANRLREASSLRVLHQEQFCYSPDRDVCRDQLENAIRDRAAFSGSFALTAAGVRHEGRAAVATAPAGASPAVHLAAPSVLPSGPCSAPSASSR